MDLKDELPRLLPKAIAWAQAEQQRAGPAGRALLAERLEIARRVGVQKPELVRVVAVERLPRPDDPQLRRAADQAGLSAPGMVAMTLGYAVFIVMGHDSVRLLSHECRHVCQYEVHGGIEGFLPVYLGQVIEYGYRDAPLEMDARNHEIHSV